MEEFGRDGTYLPKIGIIEPVPYWLLHFIRSMHLTKRPFGFLIFAFLLLCLIIIHKITKEMYDAKPKGDSVSVKF